MVLVHLVAPLYLVDPVDLYPLVDLVNLCHRVDLVDLYLLVDLVDLCHRVDLTDLFHPVDLVDLFHQVDLVDPVYQPTLDNGMPGSTDKKARSIFLRSVPSLLALSSPHLPLSMK